MFRFDAEKTKSLTAPAETIELDAAQTQLLRDLTALVSPRLGLDPIPCHGLWLQAVRDWQLRHGKAATTITKMAPADRLEAAMHIRDRFIEAASELLRAPEQRAALADVVKDAFALYTQKYQRRPTT